MGYRRLTPGLDSGNRVIFHGHVGDSWNTWQALISPDTWRVESHPASHVRDNGRSGRIDDLERPDGVHEPNERCRHLEPANRH